MKILEGEPLRQALLRAYKRKSQERALAIGEYAYITIFWVVMLVILMLLILG